LEESLKETMELEEKQKETINNIEKKIGNWQNSSPEERNKFLSSLRFDLALLPDTSREIIINEISKARIYKKEQLRKEIKLGKNPTSKYSKEFLNKTIEVWQPYSSTPLSLNNAREISGNMTALFNILIAEDKKCNNKSIIKNNSYTKNKISKEVKKWIK
jgi:hypothetical protein